MKTLRIEIITENDAFQDGNMDFELCRILSELTRKIANYNIDTDDRFILRDLNGNKVGEALAE